MIIDVVPNVKMIRPEGQTVYPYSNSIYLDDDIKTMIDTGSGGNAYKSLPADLIELVLLSHYHFDHVNGVSWFNNAQIYVGKEEAEVYKDPELYMQQTGRHRWKELMGKDKSEMLRVPENFPGDIPVPPGFQAVELTGTIQDGQVFNLGSTKLRAVHLPGHTIGHYGFYMEEQSLLFSGDLDLAPQGPWYGGESSDVGQLINSIQKIIDINPQILITSHRRVFKAQNDNIIQMLKEYMRVPIERENKILEVLSKAGSIEDIIRSGALYPQSRTSEYTLFYAKMMTMKHIKHLIRMGRVDELESGLYKTRS